MKSKHTEKAIQEHFYHASIIESSDDAILSKTLDGTITSWNPAAQRIFGFTAQEVVGKSINIIIPPDLYDEEKEILKKISKGERIKNFTTMRLKKNGKKIYASVTVSPIKNDKGTIIGASTIAHDITKHKAIEQKLRESEERYRLLFEHATDLVTVIDTEGKYVFASPSHLPMVGYLPEELIGKRAFSFVHPDDLSRVKREFTHALAGRVGHLTLRFKHKNGSWRVLESTGSGILNELHRPTMVIVMSHDITERVHMEQRKDEFIGIASHELKTPLTSIKVFSQLMQKYNQEKKDFTMLTYLSKMDQQIEKLNKLIQDLLDISKIQAGKMVFRSELFPLMGLVKEVVDIMQTTTAGHKLLIQGSADFLINGDRDRIGQVLTNFISNAIKYSPNAKKIIIHVNTEDKKAIIGVQDFGIGIPREHQTRIFERFYRVEGENQKTFPGFGIGLYISSGIIKRHKGDVWVESEEGKGSTFYFSLPVRKQ